MLSTLWRRPPRRDPLEAAGRHPRNDIGLLAVTGMRVGEALKLDDTDIDPVDGVLVARESKFGKTRLVPVAPSTVDALAAYTVLRDRLVERRVPAVFVSVRGNRTIYACVQETFRRLCG